MRFYSSKKKIITVKQCVKSVQVWSFFWSIFSCIQSGYRKIRTRENPVFGHFSCSEKTCNSSLVGMGLPSPTNWLLHHWKLLNLSLLCNLRWPLLFEFHPNVLYHSPFQKCCEDVLLILFIANQVICTIIMHYLAIRWFRFLWKNLVMYILNKWREAIFQTFDVPK